MRPVCLVLLAAALVLRAQPGAAGDRVFQYSTINALLAGLYDGDLSFGALAKEGDFGLGTLNRLDGEMVALDGAFYQVRTDGHAYLVPETALTPFAVMTRFAADRTVPLPAGLDLKGLTAYLDGLIQNPNHLYAVRIDGVFPALTVRSVPAQTSPYRKLAQVIEDQVEFHLKDAEGTLVAFRTPSFLAGLNVPGYHLHFLSKDRSRGGHVLGLETGSGTIALDEIADLEMRLPKLPAFAAADLAGARAVEIGKVEKQGN
jgi:acetolactate decarboxylase